MVSFYGGNISYLLFYFALLLPVLTLTYSIFVYTRFKIVQDMERTVIKSQKVPYSLILANEDMVPFTNISLNYFTERVTILDFKEERTEGNETIDTCHLCLLPGESIHINTKMYCKYRGVYPVGVKSVTVTDFLGIFTITYPMKEQICVTVKPRILPFEQFTKPMEQKDPKNILFSAMQKQELPDFELRPYQPGDTPKLIHWKNSSRAGELLVRKQMPEELFEVILVFDLTPIKDTAKNPMDTEDDILEATLSFAHHYCMKQIPIRIVFMEKELTEYTIYNQRDFEKFYSITPNLLFSSSFTIDEVWSAYTAKTKHHSFALWITASITDAMQKNIEQHRKTGTDIVLINTGDIQL